MDVRGLFALRTLGKLKFHRLPLIQSLITFALNGAVMNKNILAATVGGYKTIAFFIAEPLHHAFCHALSLLV